MYYHAPKFSMHVTEECSWYLVQVDDSDYLDGQKRLKELFVDFDILFQLKVSKLDMPRFYNYF